MLQTQVAYWQLEETKAHNRATEEQARNELQELARHNQLTERLGFFNYAETAKHNRATEKISSNNLKLGWYNARELSRHNRQQESVAWANSAISATNAATQARKVGYDNINMQYANRTNRMNAYNNQANTIVRQQELLQTKRSNDIREASIPAQYLNLLPTPKIDVVRKVTKTKVKRVAK